MRMMQMTDTLGEPSYRPGARPAQAPEDGTRLSRPGSPIHEAPAVHSRRHINALQEILLGVSPNAGQVRPQTPMEHLPDVYDFNAASSP